jgi:hypothetical protein
MKEVAVSRSHTGCGGFLLPTVRFCGGAESWRRPIGEKCSRLTIYLWRAAQAAPCPSERSNLKPQQQQRQQCWAQGFFFFFFASSSASHARRPGMGLREGETEATRDGARFRPLSRGGRAVSRLDEGVDSCSECVFAFRFLSCCDNGRTTVACEIGCRLHFPPYLPTYIPAFAFAPEATSAPKENHGMRIPWWSLVAAARRKEGMWEAREGKKMTSLSVASSSYECSPWSGGRWWRRDRRRCRLLVFFLSRPPPSAIAGEEGEGRTASRGEGEE